ncbi:MAG: zinc-binding alcohol dehydrogenase [Planctomycetota bacterium]
MKKIWVEPGGTISVKDEPEPELRPHWYLTDTQYSLISAGTETMHVRNQMKPGATGPRRIGYSNSGIVREAGEGATRFEPGQLVGCYGSGYADHQSVSAVPETLMAPCPEPVTPEQAAFCGVATFGLNGLRLCELSFGDVVAVIGLGLIGQITLQIAEAAGYRTVGLSHSDKLLELASELGAHGVVKAGEPDSIDRAIEMAVDLGGAEPAEGRPGGFDAAVACSGRTGDNTALLEALDLIRDKGAVCIVGAPQLEFPRAPFFAREARLVIARAAGVGRYDPHHEDEAEPIPHSHVRWTEGRNLAEVVRLIGEGKLNVDRLITHRFDVTDAAEAYDLILNRPKECLGVLFRYDESDK